MKRSPASRWLALAAVTLLAPAVAGAAKPLAQWSFEDAVHTVAHDSVSKRDDVLSGYAKRVPGVRGQAIRLDGYTTGITRVAAHTPVFKHGVTFESWIALEAYPWGPCAILNQAEQQTVELLTQEREFPPEPDPSGGFLFGIDANGHLLLQMAIDGRWLTCRSQDPIPLLHWTHVVGAYDPTTRCLDVFVNGRLTGRVDAPGAFHAASHVDLLMGRNHQPRPPQYPIRLNIPALYGIEGLLDEVKIHDRALTASEVAQTFAAMAPPPDSGLRLARLPDLASAKQRFGAFHTRLSYNDTWDAVRREGPASDIVVTFDEQPWRYVFWRGTNYIPHWVTENGIWYTNEFNETWGHGALGCAEPMSDKQARHARIQIVESSDARVVVHWRYALIDTRYVFARQDPLTGWGDWSDEYHIIYPDGVGVRKIQLWSTQPVEPHEFQESIVLIPAGSRPEDVIATEALTMANLEGEAHTYSWAERAPDKIDRPARANIEIVNTRSRAKPFLIVSDEPFELAGQAYAAPLFRPFNMEVKRENSIFPWWNHWPVAQIPSDGRWATEPDRIAHSSLSTGLEWMDWEVTPNSRTRVMLHGLTERDPSGVARLGRSWLRAPPVTVPDGAPLKARYDQSERAYVLESFAADGVRFSVAASSEHPLVNPAFICRNWRGSNVTLRIDGKPVPRGREFRYGIRRTWEGDDLIVWLRLESEQPVTLELSPGPSGD